MSANVNKIKTPKGFQRAVSKLALLKFFPPGADERAELMAELGRVCDSDENVMWLAQRSNDLYQEWPGLRALWQIWFSKFPPKNDREKRLESDTCRSDRFPEGVPAESDRASEGGFYLPPAGSPVGEILAEAVAGLKALPAPAKKGKATVSAKEAEADLETSLAAKAELKGV